MHSLYDMLFGVPVGAGFDDPRAGKVGAGDREVCGSHESHGSSGVSGRAQPAGHLVACLGILTGSEAPNRRDRILGARASPRHHPRRQEWPTPALLCPLSREARGNKDEVLSAPSATPGTRSPLSGSASKTRPASPEPLALGSSRAGRRAITAARGRGGGSTEHKHGHRAQRHDRLHRRRRGEDRRHHPVLNSRFP